MKAYVITDELLEQFKVYLPARADYLIDKVRESPLEAELRKDMEQTLELFEVCLQEEGFWCLDQDDPVVLVPDVKKLITALRETTYG